MRSAIVAFEPGRIDEIGIDRKRRPVPQQHEVDGRLQPQRIEIIEIGYVRQHRHHDTNPAAGRCEHVFRRSIETEHILGREPVGIAKIRHQAERRPTGALGHEAHTVRKQGRVAPHLVDDEACDQFAVIGIYHGGGAAEAGDHPATVDIADHDHRNIGGAGKPHIGDIVGAQIHFRRRTGAFDQHQVALRANSGEAVEHVGQQFSLAGLILARPRVAEDASLYHDLGADFALRLQQHRIHIDRWHNARGAGLQRLGAADLAAVGGHRRVVGHVLRFERANGKSAGRQQAAKAGDDQRLADVRAGPLKHQRARGHQNSMPAWVITPAAK